METTNTILLADDDENDLCLLQRCIERAGIRDSIQTVTDGVLAIAYLKGEPPYQDRTVYPLPSVVLLDWKFSLKSGAEVLRWIRAQPEFESLPVAMLSSFEDPNQKHVAYDSGATVCLEKHGDFSEVVQFLLLLPRLPARADAKFERSGLSAGDDSAQRPQKTI